MTDDLLLLFQNSTEVPMTYDIPSLRAKSVAFESTIRNRNRIELLACGLVVLLFGLQLATASSVAAALGPLMVILGTLFVAWRFVTAATHPVADATAANARFVEEHRKELLFQADLLAAVPRWYLGPLVPGLAWMFGLSVVDAWDTPYFLAAALISAGAGVFFVAIGWMNLRAASTLRRRAEAL